SRPQSSAPAPRHVAPARSFGTAAPAAPARYAPATHAPPPTAAPPMASQSQGPGLMGQMAATAGGVAIGSTIGNVVGNGISSLFSSSPEPAAAAPAAAVAATAPVMAANGQDQYGARNCDFDARSFTRCMDENNGNMQTCDWYLQQLKACQEAARQY
ncbi:hypothetical protein NADFUDRAFT_10555, partial [Nadsonia fulvescens var. elongata DSM 6958]